MSPPDTSPSSPHRHPARLLLVTGSGRSGTSTVAGALKRLGLRIPQPEIPADENNPRGYYEPRWVIDFHKRLLNPIPVRTIDSRPDAGELAAAAVTSQDRADLRAWLSDQVTQGPADFVVKDPRSFWVHGLWAETAAEVGVELSSLTMLRHPAQVVRSRDSAYLTDKNERFRRERETTNVAAWVNAALETERVTRGHRRTFVPYPDLVGDWRAALTRAGDQLSLDLGDVSAPHPVDDFVDSSLNRSAPQWEGLAVPPELVEMAERTWQALQRLVVVPSDPEAIGNLGLLRAEYDAMYETASAVAQDVTTARVSSVRRSLQERLDKKNARIEKLRARVRELEEQLGQASRSQGAGTGK